MYLAIWRVGRAYGFIKGIKTKRVYKLSGWPQRTKEFYIIQRVSCEKLSVDNIFILTRNLFLL